MVDLSPLDRLTRKRNTLLQKQLDVQLQIMQEEFRMTKKDLEKNTRELTEFLMCLRHTAPGLGSYGQPDTRAMNYKNILLERRYKDDDNDDSGPDEILYQRPDTKTTSTKGGKDAGTEQNEDTEQLKPSSAASSRKEFFNRRIVLDSKRHSFLQHTMEKKSSKPADSEKMEDPRRLGGAVSHAGFLSNRDTKGEITTKRPKTSTPRSHRPETPKYGREAYSKQEESVRKYILNRFDVIFEPQDEKPRSPKRRTIPAATPLFVPKDIDTIGAPTSTPLETVRENYPHPVSSTPVPSSSTPLPASPTRIFSRRVAWSAPPKRHEDPIHVVANTNNVQLSRGNRQNISVTPRTGTGHMAKRPPRPPSTMSIMSQDERGIDPRFFQQKFRGSKRPKTAPPNYELRQRNMAAPRQQVAGIMAEMQSRRADTRAMLTKSKQLKQMVKMLAPPEQKDDSFSD